MDEDRMGEFSDEQLEDLFSAFDEVSAPESLKASTLGLIASLPTAAVQGEVAHEAAQEASAQASAAQPASKASAGGKRPRPRPRMRAFRTAAVAACLTLAVTGGAAYATPVSVVTLTQGDASIELGVDLFGMSVSATSDDETGRAIIDSTNLVHVSYGDAFTRAASALDAAAGGGELEVFIDSAVGLHREQLEGQNQQILADRGEPGLPAPSSGGKGQGPKGDSQPPRSETDRAADGQRGAGLPGADQPDVAQPAAQASAVQPDAAQSNALYVQPTSFQADYSYEQSEEASQQDQSAKPAKLDLSNQTLQPVLPTQPTQPNRPGDLALPTQPDDSTQPGQSDSGDQAASQPGQESEPVPDPEPDPSPDPEPTPEPDPEPTPEPVLVWIDVPDSDDTDDSDDPDDPDGEGLIAEEDDRLIYDFAPIQPQGAASDSEELPASDSSLFDSGQFV